VSFKFQLLVFSLSNYKKWGNQLQRLPEVKSILQIINSESSGAWELHFSGELIKKGIVNILFKLLFYKLDLENRPKMQALTSGISTRYGINFTSLIIAFQPMCLDKKN